MSTHKKPEVTEQQEKKIEERIRHRIEEDIRKQIDHGQFERKKRKGDETTGDGGAEIGDTEDGGAEEE